MRILITDDHAVVRQGLKLILADHFRRAVFGEARNAQEALNRVWKDGDKVEVSLPMSLHIDPMPDDPTFQAVMYGPLVLAGRLGDTGLSKALTYPGYDTAPSGESVPVPAIASGSKHPLAWVEPVNGQPLAFRTSGQNESVPLVPLYRLSSERYAVYWKVSSQAV